TNKYLGIIAIRLLQSRQIDERDGRFSQAGKRDVACNADDFEPGTAWPAAESFTDRILIREIKPGRRFVDDHDTRRARAILVGEAPPFDNRDAHQFVITRPNLIEFNPEVFAWLSLITFDHYTH